MSSEQSDRRTEQRRRGIRHALAVVFALPPIAMLILDPPIGQTASLGWPVEWQAAFVVCMTLSLAAGWKPAKEAWTGEDHDIYVSEPEVDDDW